MGWAHLTPARSRRSQLRQGAALDAVKGIGPRMAQQLVQTRHQARYMDWLDLITRTPGLGANTASKLSANGLGVNGLPFPNLAPSAPR
jgi:excinuclease UvrABC nuclease subunit